MNELNQQTLTEADPLKDLYNDWSEILADTGGGVRGTWCRPAAADSSPVLVYIHAAGSASRPRKLAAHVTKAPGVVVFVLDYRRAPEHPHPDALGGSPGGSLALATALAHKQRGKALANPCTPTTRT